MTIQQAGQYLIEKLQTIYNTSEAENITIWVIESLTGNNRLLQRVHQHQALTDEQALKLSGYLKELMEHRPVQYVLGECYFMDMKLFVDENVLVPRPETEELVDWIIKHCQAENKVNPSILDIGTGSGCIALALKKHLPGAAVTAIDIAPGALAVATKNAANLKLDINWQQGNILDKAARDYYGSGYDVIVSNPPYITTAEQGDMLPNVLRYEPHNALFVTDNDPQQFYKAIEVFAAATLQQGGVVFLELNRDFAKDTQSYYENKGWETVLKQDMQGNDRMLMAQHK